MARHSPIRGFIFSLLKWGAVRILLDFGVPNVFFKCFQLHSQHVPQVPNVFPKCSIDTYAIRKWLLTQVENGDQLF
jgi:hypothetical protein